MSAIGSLLVVFGLILILIGGIWFIVAAFRESLLWGLGVIFLPIVDLIFLVVHWRRARDPFFLQLWGLAFILLGHLVFQAQLPWH